MKLKILLLMICLLTITTGCGYKRAIVKNPLSTDEVLKYVTERLRDSNEKVSIDNHSDLSVCVMEWIDDSCMIKDSVEDAYCYQLKITNSVGTKIVGTATYCDSYTLGGEDKSSYFKINYFESTD